MPKRTRASSSDPPHLSLADTLRGSEEVPLQGDGRLLHKRLRLHESTLSDKQSWDCGDWESLKELYADAIEHVERDDIQIATILLRAVIRECRRFLEFYKDPSVFFASMSRSRSCSTSPHALTPSDERLARDWGVETTGSHVNGTEQKSRRSPTILHATRPNTEHPNAFYSLYGSTLFLFGNLIARYPEHLEQEEPANPDTYFVAAHEVFQTADRIPKEMPKGAVTSSILLDENADDWQMPIAWGRTLIALAGDRAIQASIRSRSRSTSLSVIDSSSSRARSLDPPPSHSHSPFPSGPISSPMMSPLAMPRSLTDVTPVCSMLLQSTPHELFMQAQDLLNSGMFRMPHPRTAFPKAGLKDTNPDRPNNTQLQNSKLSVETQITNHLQMRHTSRPKVTRYKTLYTIGIEILSFAEQFIIDTDRREWGVYAESVLSHLEVELRNLTNSRWTAPVKEALERCTIITQAPKRTTMEIN